MKKKILVLLGAVLVFGLAFAAYALTNTGMSSAAEKTSCSCCKGDSCPMKDKKASAATAADTAACECDCCKGANGEHANCTCCGDSCPMKGAHGDHAAMKMAEGETCPMMKGDAAAGHAMHATADHKMAADGTSCSCACCKKDKAAKENAPEV